MKNYQEFISNYKLDKNPYPGFDMNEIEEFSKSEIDEIKQFVEDFEIDEDFKIIWKILR